MSHVSNRPVLRVVGCRGGSNQEEKRQARSFSTGGKAETTSVETLRSVAFGLLQPTRLMVFSVGGLEERSALRTVSDGDCMLKESCY